MVQTGAGIGFIQQSMPQLATNTSVWDEGQRGLTGSQLPDSLRASQPPPGQPYPQQVHSQYLSAPQTGHQVAAQPPGGTGLLATGESTLHTLSSLPTGVSLTSTQGELIQAYASASNTPTLGATGIQGTYELPQQPGAQAYSRGASATGPSGGMHRQTSATTQIKQTTPRQDTLDSTGNGDDTWKSDPSLPPRTPRSREGDY